MSELFEIRDGTKDDEPFVFSSWLESYKESKLARAVVTGTYLRGHHRVIEQILKRPGVKVRVAHVVGDPVVVLGWAVVEAPETLHYVLVKYKFRGHGIARALVGSCLPHVAVATHKCADVERWFQEHPRVKYDPYAAFLAAGRAA